MTTDCLNQASDGHHGYARRGLQRKAAEDEDENEENVRLKLPNILTYDEIDRFTLAVDSYEDLIASRLMLFGGLRVAEASELRVKDLQNETLSVFVNQGKGNKDRYAPIDVTSLAIARCYAIEHDLGPEDRLFSCTKRTLQRHVEETYERAMITWGAACHTMRHTCATWQLDKGVPLPVVQGNLGHEDIETTQIYLHLNIRQRSRTYHDCARFGV